MKADLSARIELAKIHIAKQQLGMNDDTYRAMLAQVAGVTSAKALDARGRQRLLAHLEKLGFTPKASKRLGRQPHGGRNKQALLSKLTALLADAGRPYTYADGMARHMFSVDAVSFLDADQLYKLVQALAVDQRRRRQRERDAIAAAAKAQAQQDQTPA